MIENDFTLYKDRKKSKVFTFTVNGVALDLSTDDSVVLSFSNDSFATQKDITGSVATNVVTFPFLAADVDTEGDFLYKVVRTPTDNTLAEMIATGNIFVVEENNYPISLVSMLVQETPANMTIDINFRTQKIHYWQLFLREAFDIVDADVHVESAWPHLVNHLIAKLVVYDKLVLEYKNLAVSASGSGEKGNLKKIETGPAMVEFWDSNEGLKFAFTPSSDGLTPFDRLNQDLCDLAYKLKVKVGPCLGKKKPIIPQKVGRLTVTDTETLLKYYGE